MSIEKRAHAIKQYTKEAAFYIECVRHTYSPLVIRHPNDDSGPPKSPVVSTDTLLRWKDPQMQVDWLTTVFWRTLRDLDFTGNACPTDTPTRAERVDLVFQDLRIDESHAHLYTGPGAAVWRDLMCYMVQERLRSFGMLLKKTDLVTMAEDKTLTWNPATACFYDMAWQSNGHVCTLVEASFGGSLTLLKALSTGLRLWGPLSWLKASLTTTTGPSRARQSHDEPWAATTTPNRVEAVDGANGGRQKRWTWREQLIANLQDDRLTVRSTKKQMKPTERTLS